MNIMKRIACTIACMVLLAMTSVSSAQVTDVSQRREALAKWSTYRQIANQATDHSAFDQLLVEAEKATTDAETQSYDAQLWTALKHLIATGETKTGQFDLTALVASSFEVREFTNSKTGNVTYTLTDMPAGNYTLKVQAFQRPADNLTSNSWYESGRDVYKTNMFLGSAMQPIKNINDDARFRLTQASSDTEGANSLSVPGSLAGAKAAFNAGLYWNVMRTTVEADGDLRVGVRIASASTDNWMVCGQMRLYYGAKTVEKTLRQLVRYNITEDTYANVETDIVVNPGKPVPLCLPFNLNKSQTDSLFKAVYVLGGVEEVDGKLVGKLVPVSTIEAGHSYYVEVDETTTVGGKDVLMRAVVPDSVPALWEGGYMVGTYMTKGYGATLYLSPALQPKASTLTLQPMDYNDMSFTTNLENTTARRYLATGPYTEASPSVISSYYMTPPLRRDQPKAVVIPVPESTDRIKLTLAFKPDFSDGKSQNFVAGTTMCEVQNLVPQRTYYYKVEQGEEVLTSGQFKTEGVVRMIKASSVSNIRDLGGWTNCDGNTVRYEKIYRGSELNVGQVLNSYDLRKLQMVGMAAEIDLRATYNVNGQNTASTFGSSVPYYFSDLGRWSDNTLQLDVDKWSGTFKFLVNNVNAGKPLYFHCAVGADRTGCLAQLIEGVLGLSRDQMYHDYELTSYSPAGERKKVKLDPAINYVIQSSKGHTMQEHYFHYLVTKLGVSATDLRDFVNNMIDGETAMLHYPLSFDFADDVYFESMSDIYARCTVGSKVHSGARAQLQADGGEATAVTMKVEGPFIVFANTTLNPATTYTLTIPASAIDNPEGTSNTEAVSLRFQTPDTFAQRGYLYAPALDKFVSRGANFGCRIIADNFGLPVAISTDTDGDRLLSFLDNGLYLSHDGYGDRASTATNLKWTIETVDDGFVLKSSTGKYMALTGNSYLTANASTAAQATKLVMKTAAEQREIVSRLQFDNNIAALKKAGVETTDDAIASQIAAYKTTNLTSNIKNATSGSTGSWPLTEPADAKTASAQAYNTGNYGGELFNKHGYVSQTISVDRAGLYKVTATILSRQGSNANCYSLGREGYALSNAYISVNDTYWAQVPDWYSAAASSSNPDNTGQAKTLMDQGKYRVELYAYVDASKRITIKVHQPAYTVFTWCVFNNFTLTRIETEGGTDIEDPDADLTGEGYTDLLPSMFRQWDDAVNPTTSSDVACEYHIDEPAITVYGDASLPYLNYADLSDYEKLIVVVTSDTPRMYFNKVDGGKYDASNEAASGRIEITPAGGWAEKYYTVENGRWTIDLKQMVADKGYARLNGIKGPTYDTPVTVSKMVLYKTPRRLPANGEKGYLYSPATKKFVTADGTLGNTGELFTIKDENTTFTTPDGRTLPAFRFLTDHQSAGGDHGSGQTMLSVRNLDRVTTTEDYGYGVFSLYLGESGSTFRIMNAKNADRGIHKQYDCLGYEGDVLKFVAEADAPYWIFMSESEYEKQNPVGDARAALQQVIEAAETVNPLGYSESSLEALDKAVEAAKDLLNDSAATTENLEKATTDVQTALEGLTLGDGYSLLDASMYHIWSGDAPGSTIVGNYDGTSGDDTFYGDGNLVIENYADLTDYDKLIITVTSNTPRLFFNKVDGGKYNASDENGSGRIEISTAGGWAEKYFTVIDGVWTIDLAAIRADKGYVHLNAIKGPAYGQSVDISSMLLYKASETTGISQVSNWQMVTDESVVYTISGQRVAAPQRGLNIVDGKKVLVK